MEYAEENDIPGLFLLIDFEKAFDSISWNFLSNILKFFNFWESIQKWVKTFYNNIKSAVNQGGNLSEFFRIERGCRQGDPLSPYLFDIESKAFSKSINKNKPGISFSSAYSIISNKSLIFSPMYLPAIKQV
jgi:hypothetical protein